MGKAVRRSEQRRIRGYTWAGPRPQWNGCGHGQPIRQLHKQFRNRRLLGESAAVSIEKSPAGFKLHFSGVYGQSCNVQRATNVSGPWSNIATLTAPSVGNVE